MINFYCIIDIRDFFESIKEFLYIENPDGRIDLRNGINEYIRYYSEQIHQSVENL